MVAGLQRIVENLKRSVADREGTILRLTAKVDSLATTVVGLQTDVRRGQERIVEQQQVIEEKRREIGTIYYFIGTKKELRERGIITEKGGVIGLGKSIQLSGAFRQGDFHAMDTDLTTDIPIQGLLPQVLSAQSKSSYVIQAGEGQSWLRILDAKEFRKVKYLVIMVK